MPMIIYAYLGLLRQNSMIVVTAVTLMA